jgi:hypothetical protein
MMVQRHQPLGMFMVSQHATSADAAALHRAVSQEYGKPMGIFYREASSFCYNGSVSPGLDQGAVVVLHKNCTCSCRLSL